MHLPTPLVLRPLINPRQMLNRKDRRPAAGIPMRTLARSRSQLSPNRRKRPLSLASILKHHKTKNARDMRPKRRLSVTEPDRARRPVKHGAVQISATSVPVDLYGLQRIAGSQERAFVILAIPDCGAVLCRRDISSFFEFPQHRGNDLARH